MTFTIKPIHSRRRGRRIRRIIGPLFTVAFFVFLAGAISLAALTAWVRRDLPNPNTLLERRVAQSTKIYDRTGEHLLYDIHGSERRTLIKLGELPQHLIDATLAIEDKNFYQHRGYVIRSIIRAAAANLFSRGRVQGGSTLTQQFIKNAVLTPEKTFARKIREFILSIEIERRFSKEEILQLYFNEIPYGRANYGAEAASQSYFGKSARELTVAESAALAALPQAPTTYLNNPDRLLARRNLIIDLMVEQKYLPPEEANRAKARPLEIQPRLEAIEAAHFVLWVKEQLTQTYGERTVEQGGLKVTTTIDYEKQKAAEEVIAAGLEKIEQKGGTNAALVALDPKTGQILAMVGSRDYFDEEHDGAVNVTLRARQPGSSFKPVVYATGFTRGYTPTTLLYDVVTTFKAEPKEYTPHNYDSKEHGLVTVRQALAGSLNIPAVKMLYLTGVSRVLDFAESLGYSTFHDRSRFGLSLVLGGGEVKLLEHTSAYATFANDGLRLAPISVLRIEDANGQTLLEWKSREGKRIMEAQIARLISDVLSDNSARAFIFGATNFLTLPDRPVAAKTGTTNDYRDAWTLGYTPSLAAGVWVGNNDNKEMDRGADGSVVAAPIWQAFMKKAHEDAPPESFMPPDPIVTGKPVLDGLLPEGIHSILHFVNKDDPRGPTPTDPTTDPQYTNWEAAVARWAAEQSPTPPPPSPSPI